MRLQAIALKCPQMMLQIAQAAGGIGIRQGPQFVQPDGVA